MELTKEQIVTELKSLIEEGNKVLKTVCCNDVNSAMFVAWHTKVLTFLALFMTEQNKSYINMFKNQYHGSCSFSCADTALKIVCDIAEYVEKGFIDIGILNE